MASVQEASELPRLASDAELLSCIASGNGAAFGLLAERLSPMLKRTLYRLGLTDSEIEDTMQETLIRIWRGSASYKGESSVSTWACRIALNQGVSTFRSKKSHTSIEPVVVAVGDTETTWERRLQAEAVRKAVVSLPLQLRTVVVLREFEDLSYRTIAEILQIPIGTVMSRLHEGRSRLRRQLARAM
jgi:RNA polymerase sigma-70 factor (ECF subfamily)